MLNVSPTIPNTLVTTYLHMTEPGQFRPAYSHDPSIIIRRIDNPDVAFYRFLYSEVGREWRWRDRLLLSDEELAAILADPGVTLYVLYVEGIPAGYIELKKHDDGSIEVAYFGLRPAFMGRGLGKHLLSYGIAQAWQEGAKRIWLHTCNLDSPHALSNYLKRGFSVFDVRERPMPERYY